jgi:hypothetical protein
LQAENGVALLFRKALVGSKHPGRQFRTQFLSQAANLFIQGVLQEVEVVVSHQIGQRIHFERNPNADADRTDGENLGLDANLDRPVGADPFFGGQADHPWPVEDQVLGVPLGSIQTVLGNPMAHQAAREFPRQLVGDVIGEEVHHLAPKAGSGRGDVRVHDQRIAGSPRRGRSGPRTGTSLFGSVGLEASTGIDPVNPHRESASGAFQ